MKEGPSANPTPTQPTHVMEHGKSGVGDVMEGGHLRVGGEDPKVVPTQ